MQQIIFSNEYKSIKPERLISIPTKDKVEDFFLVLGLFYNDFKNINFHLIQTENFFEDIDNSVRSVRAGEYGGIKSHLERLMSATIHEFLKFLKSNDEILKTGEFKNIYDELNLNLKKRWDIIVNISDNSKIEDDSDFFRILMLIRNNIAFHYYQSGKELRQGFIDFFFNDKKINMNEKACFYVGDNMNETRFFYCDAAAQRSLINQITKHSKIDIEQYKKKLEEVINNINHTIMALMKIYISRRPQK